MDRTAEDQADAAIGVVLLLLAINELRADIDALRAESPYALSPADGNRLTGRVRSLTPPAEFTGSIDNLNDGLLRVQFDDLHGMRDANVIVSTFDVDETAFERLRENLNGIFRRLFGTLTP